MSSKVRTIIMPLVLGAIIITLAILEYKDLFYSFDQNITRFIVNHRGSKGNALYWISRILTELGNYIFYIALLIALGFYFKWDYRVWYLVIIAVVALLFNYSIKLIVSRDRPMEAWRWMKETSASFPSSHSAVSTALYLSLFFVAKYTINNKIIKRIIMILSIILIIIIPITRLVLAVHYLTDVIGGMIVGLFIFLLGYNIYFFKKVYRKGLIVKREKRKSEYEIEE